MVLQVRTTEITDALHIYEVGGDLYINSTFARVN